MVRAQSFSATIYNPPAAKHELLDQAWVVARGRNVVEGAQEPQANRQVRRRVVADLLECRIEKALDL